MQLRRWLGLFAGVSWAAGSGLAGCSSESTSATSAKDGSADAYTENAALDSTDAFQAPDATVSCTPSNIPKPTQPELTYRPYARLAACTTAQLSSFYAACEAGSSSACQSWENDTRNASCGNCLVTPATQPAWGPFVYIGNRDRALNSAGCIGIVLGEGSSTTGCAAARWVIDRCLRGACDPECFGDPDHPAAVDLPLWKVCRDDATTGVCKPAFDVYPWACRTDGGVIVTPAAVACGLAGSETLAQRTMAVMTMFCGGAEDAGGPDAGPDGDASSD